jgi:hypothetical protein
VEAHLPDLELFSLETFKSLESLSSKNQARNFENLTGWEGGLAPALPPICLPHLNRQAQVNKKLKSGSERSFRVVAV